MKNLAKIRQMTLDASVQAWNSEGNALSVDLIGDTRGSWQLHFEVIASKTVKL
tara:strand:+ start:153 stop:311 length:159 start_codon:yes stop_codon:yes gene_type:complete